MRKSHKNSFISEKATLDKKPPAIAASLKISRQDHPWICPKNCIQLPFAFLINCSLHSNLITIVCHVLHANTCTCLSGILSPLTNIK